MRRTPEDLKSQIEVDTVTGEYYLKIPEWIINDQSWYEDTIISFKTDGSEIIISED